MTVCISLSWHMVALQRTVWLAFGLVCTFDEHGQPLGGMPVMRAVTHQGSPNPGLYTCGHSLSQVDRCYGAGDGFIGVGCG